MEKKTYELINNFYYRFDTSNLPLTVKLIEKSEDFLFFENLSIDVRLRDYRFKDNFISIVALDKLTSIPLFTSSIIYYNFNNLDLIKFWHNHSDFLTKVNIKNMIDFPEKGIFTIGFSKMDNAFKGKYILLKEFIILCRNIVEQNFYTYIETTGREDLKNSYLEQTALDLKMLKNVGCTRDSSEAVEKFARQIGLIETDTLFHIRTLGKVFLSQQLYFNYINSTFGATGQGHII